MKKLQLLGLMLCVSLMSVVSASAALSAGEQAVLDGISTKFTDYLTSGLVLFGVVTAGLIGIKIAKKVINKTT